MMKTATAKQVVLFWEKAGPQRWFKKDPAFDQRIRERFLMTYQVAEMGRLAGWEMSPEGALALIVLLDQFPRNIFRGAVAAFASDPLARAIATRAINRGFDKKTRLSLRQFFYLPFEHSENLVDQKISLKLFKTTTDRELIRWAKLHHDIIKRFGRFPHRNEILGRKSTSDEIIFLETGGFAG
jgi:uncharacterized protein (DUF924 family)